MLDRVTARTFGTLSRLRGKRIFHPHGVGFSATLSPLHRHRSGSALFDRREPAEAIVRISRSIGLPEALPDPFGLAIRVPDAYGDGRHQDFLLVSSARAPVARHLLVPARAFCTSQYSSLLPYRFGGRLVVAGAVPDEGRDRHFDLAALRGMEMPGLSLRFCVAPPLGEWIGLAKLELERRLPDEQTERIGFNPGNTGGGIELAGLPNRLRVPAYVGSQGGRGAAVREKEGRRRHGSDYADESLNAIGVSQ